MAMAWLARLFVRSYEVRSFAAFVDNAAFVRSTNERSVVR